MKKNKGSIILGIVILITIAAFAGALLFLQKDHAGKLAVPFFSSIFPRETEEPDDNEEQPDTSSDQTEGPTVGVRPKISAGADLSIVRSPYTVTLKGTAMSFSGGGLSYEWTKLSGGSATIKTPTVLSTIVSGMQKGTYVFRLVVTDSTGLKSADDLFVFVGSSSGSSGSSSGGSSSQSSGYTTAQVATHNTQANCWLIISGKIYNVTSFINEHPGGRSAITSRCGTDATAAFNSNSNGGHNHTSYARSLLPSYYIGPVGTGTTTQNPPQTQNISPFADAGSNQVVVLPASSATLSGAGSSDSDGTIASYAWTKISGGAATISSPSSSVTNVSNLVQGTYTFRLTVTDNKNATATDDVTVTVNAAPPPPPPSGYTAAQVATHNTQANCWIIISNKVYNVTPFLNSHPGGVSVMTAWCGRDATVAFHTHGHSSGGTDHTSYAYSLLPAYYVGDLNTTAPPPNTPPVADAGSDESMALPTNFVTLDGSNSFDTDGSISAYAWTKVSGGAATLGTPNEDTTDISGLVQGTYTFRLTVTDNQGATATDTAIVTVAAAPANTLPTADAGVDKTITLPTNSVSVDGSNSFDTDGSISTYAWTKTSGGAATITSPSGASTTITGLVQGSYTFRLTVTDNQGATDTDTMNVTVNAAATNVSPTADAGSDKTITLPTNSVSVDGSNSFDTDGSIASYAWTKVTGGAATITSASAATTTITGLVQGSYTFRLTVTDDQGATGTDTMNVTVNPAAANNPPTANAGVDQTITLPTNSVSLTGSGSDSDGTIASYAWTKVSGGAATIASPSAASTNVTGLVAGTYSFRLTVTDNQGATGTDTMTVTVNATPPANNPPTSNAGVDKTITLPTNSVTLNGSGADSDGTIASYLWTKISGGAATIASPSAATTSITGLLQGSYTFRLTVTDDQGATGADDAIVTVNPAPVNNPPTANAGVDKTITLPTNSVSVTGSGTDTDGTIASYAWTKVSGGAATITSPSAATTNITGLVQGSYTFRLTVTDDQGATGTDTMLVTVNAAANNSPTANAGSDQTITLPTNSITLSGSGSDSDGTIASYAWAKISGGAATITSASSASTTVTGLVQGSYTFRLTVTDNQGATGTDTMAVTVNPAAAQTYTAAQVATHNTQANCWIIISSKVYGVSSFISQHPGGTSAIVSRCGTDATTAFNSNAGSGHNHSSYARSLLPTYYLGDLVP